MAWREGEEMKSVGNEQKLGKVTEGEKKRSRSFQICRRSVRIYVNEFRKFASK